MLDVRLRTSKGESAPRPVGEFFVIPTSKLRGNRDGTGATRNMFRHLQRALQGASGGDISRTAARRTEKSMSIFAVMNYACTLYFGR
jgi:hypothetical protein